MAEEEKKDGAETNGAEKPKKDRGPLKLLGGVVGLVVVGSALAMMAIPKKAPEKPRFKGPFHYRLFETDLVGNSSESNWTRFLKVDPHAQYFAYDEAYVNLRIADPLYMPWLKSDLTAIVSATNMADALSGQNREQFSERIRGAIEPIIFPVHLGKTDQPLQIDEVSGLRPGDSNRRATFRGAFHDHVMKVDATAKTLQIDDGPLIRFNGGELDLKVLTPSGDDLYVDVTELKEDFVGEIPIGVHGRVRQVDMTILGQ